LKTLEGFFIEATEEQMALIWEAVALNGLTHDSKGILAYIMLCIEEEDEEDEPEAEQPDAVKMIFDHLAQNPAQAEAIKQAGSKLFASVFNKFKKPQ
jgi:hypothetical protein